MKLVGTLARAAVILVALGLSADAGKTWHPIEIDVWDPPFNRERQRRTETYSPLDTASEPWRICVSIPHLKDDYWTAVNFGLIDEARRLGIRMQLYSAGGYGNLETQRKQIAECMASGADGIIVSAVAADGLNDLVAEYAKQGKPVVDLINGMSSPRITARAAGSYWDLGNRTARYLRELHGEDGKPAEVAWFPGPDGAAWMVAGDAGFRAGLEGSPLKIVASANGDTGRAVQGKLVEAALDAHPDVRYVVGTSVTAEAAAVVLRKRRLTEQIRVLAYYYSPGVHRGVRRGQIVAAPSDKPAIVARMAVDQVVRALEGKLALKHIAPKVVVIDSENVRSVDTSAVLPPRGFRPIFSVNPW